MKKYSRIGVFVAASLAATGALATNGYWSHGYGPKSKSIAGACVAMPLGAMCASTNPASLVHSGNRMEYGLALFSPDRGFHANDDYMPPGPMGPANIPPGDYDSNTDFFPIPHFGYNRMLDENSSIGISLGANGGLNTDYDEAVFRNFANPMMPETLPEGGASIDLMQAFAGVTYSRKLDEQHAIGITPILAIQTLEAKGLNPFIPFSAHPEAVTNNGRDIAWGLGVRVGWMGMVTDRLTLGASYQSRIHMGEFEDYKGLLAEGGDFDIPSNFDLGFSYKITPDVTFAFDYQHINFSEVAAVGNAADLVFMPGQTLLGTDDGLGFGWQDIDVFKFGVEWRYRKDLSFRAGFSESSDAFPASQALMNVLAPAVVQRHYTFGFSKAFDDHNELSVALLYVPEERLHGSNPNTGPQTGYLRMSQWELGVGWSKTF